MDQRFRILKQMGSVACCSVPFIETAIVNQNGWSGDEY